MIIFYLVIAFLLFSWLVPEAEGIEEIVSSLLTAAVWPAVMMGLLLHFIFD